MKYEFINIEVCNMCQSPIEEAKVLGRRLNKSQGKRPKKTVGLTTTVMKCKACNLIFSNPLPIPETLDQHYGVPPESYWKGEYFKVEPTLFKDQIDTFFRLNRIQSDKYKFLDIGAGIGKI